MCSGAAEFGGTQFYKESVADVTFFEDGDERDFCFEKVWHQVCVCAVFVYEHFQCSRSLMFKWTKYFFLILFYQKILF